MSGVQYLEIRCKSALNRVHGMPFKWSLNPYRGCVHACHYCYARASHTFYGMNADGDFETKILVKTNFADVLRRELARGHGAPDSGRRAGRCAPFADSAGDYRLARIDRGRGDLGRGAPRGVLRRLRAPPGALREGALSGLRRRDVSRSAPPLPARL